MPDPVQRTQCIYSLNSQHSNEVALKRETPRVSELPRPDPTEADILCVWLQDLSQEHTPGSQKTESKSEVQKCPLLPKFLSSVGCLTSPTVLTSHPTSPGVAITAVSLHCKGPHLLVNKTAGITLLT